jgi:hypothetical protein
VQWRPSQACLNAAKGPAGTARALTERDDHDKIFYAFALAAVLFAGASPSMARTSSWTDLSDQYGGFSPNSQEGSRAFWDYQTRHGR